MKKLRRLSLKFGFATLAVGGLGAGFSAALSNNVTTLVSNNDANINNSLLMNNVNGMDSVSEIVDVHQTSYCGVEQVKKWDTDYEKHACNIFQVNDLLHSKEPVHNQWNENTKINNTGDYADVDATFGMKNSTVAYKKALFWTTAITVKIPAKSSIFVKIKDIKYDLHVKLKTPFDLSRGNLGVWGVGVSRIYENINEHPNIFIGEKDIGAPFFTPDGGYERANPQYGSRIDYTINWEGETSKQIEQRKKIVEMVGENPSGGFQFTRVRAHGGSGWHGAHVKETDDICPNFDPKWRDGVNHAAHCDTSLTKTKRTIKLINSSDKVITKTVYVDSWILASPLGTSQHKDLPISLADGSYLKYRIGLSCYGV